MLKGIAEKVILSYFGKFIKGVQKDNLTVDVFGGNFKIENISLNNEFFDKLDIPIRLVYSSIGKLNVQMTLSKISSVPVECILDNIFVIFEFKDDAFSDREHADAEQKRKVIEKYAKDCLQQFLNKLKQDKNEGGMFSKYVKKAIDNLQLKLVNFHIRFEENTKDKKYAWGVTLEEIMFITTNKEWQPAFIDRSLQQNKNAIMYKTMDVKNLNLYWCSSNVKFLKKQLPVVRQDRMAKLIYVPDGDKIISITSQFKLQINPINIFSKPVYQISIALSPLEISLQQQQVSQVIDFLERLVLHNQLKLMTRKKTEKIENLSELNEVFRKYLGNLLANEVLEVSPAQLEQVWMHIPIDQLMQWAIPEIKKIVKGQKVAELEQKKKGSWGGWFGSKEAAEISPEEVKQLQEFVENTFENQAQSVRPPSCLYFAAMLHIPYGKFDFLKKYEQGGKETVEFGYQKFQLELKKSEDSSSMQMALKLKSINLDINEHEPKGDFKCINILKNVDTSSKNFLQLKYTKNITKDVAELTTQMQVQKVIFVYRNLYLSKFRQMFTFRSVDQIMKSATLEQFQKIKDETANNEADMIEQKQIVEIKIMSPTLIIPFTDDTHLKVECWVWNFGNLKVNSVQNSEFELVKAYQLFLIKLQQVNLQYYPSMELAYEGKTSEKIFSVLHDMNFDVELRQRKPFADSEKYPKQVVDIKLSEFGINFTEKQYRNLMKLGTMFSKHDQDRILVLKKEKDALWSQKSHEGPVRKRNQVVKNYDEYYAVLSGAYLYFYKNKRQLKFVSKVYIKNSKVDILENSRLELSNRYENCTLMADTLEILQEWKDALEDKIKEYSTNVQLIQFYGKQQGPPVQPVQLKYEKKSSLTFVIDRAYFTYQSDSNIELINCRIEQLKLTKQSQTSQQRTCFSFSQFFVQDKIFIYQKKQYQPLLWVKSQNHHKPSILYIRNEEGIKKGLKTKSNIKINVKFPSLQLNWKPDVLLLVLDLLKKNQSRNASDNLREDDFEMRKKGLQEIDRNSVFNNIRQNTRFMEVGEMHEQSDTLVKNDRHQYLTFDAYSKLKPKLDALVTMDFQIHNVDIFLMHRQTHVILFNLLMSNLLVSITRTEHQKFVDGSIQDLTISELTNYPKTLHSNFEHEYIKPYKILTRSIGNTSKALIFRWGSFNTRTFINKERVDSFLYLHASPVEFHYIQQVNFRMIDYTLIQIILLLNNPEMVVANQGLLQQLEKNFTSNEKPVLVWGEYEEIAKRLVSPFFGDMFIQLDSPCVYCKAEPSSTVYFKANFANVVIHNKNIKNDRRFRTNEALRSLDYLMEFIWEEDSIIEGKDIELKIVMEIPEEAGEVQQIKEKKPKYFQKPLWCPINLSLIVNRLLNQDQIKHIYPQAQNYDRGFYIQMSSGQVRLDADRSQYLQIMKLLNFNITYDDERDNLFIHNYRITKLLSPKPINFSFNIPSLTVTAAYYMDHNIQTLFAISFEPMVITYNRGKDLNSSVGITAPMVTVSAFKDDKETIILRCPERIEGGQEVSATTAKLEVELKTNGTKIIMLYIESAKIILILNVFQLILEWVQVDDSIFPIQSSYVNQILFCTNINNVVIAWETAPTNKVKQAVAALGTLSYKFSRKKNRTEEYYMSQLKQQRMTIKDIESLPESSYMTLSLNIQLLRCRYTDFISCSFNKISKRCLIYPVTFNFTQKNQLQVADLSKYALKTSSMRNINIDRTVAKFSCRDIELICLIFEQSSKDDEYYHTIWKRVKAATLDTVGGVDLEFRPVPSMKVSSEQSSLDTMDLRFESLSFYVINNYGQSLVPVIQFQLSELELKRLLTFKKTIMEASFALTISYFNGGILKWEPFLEKTGININYSCYFSDKLKKILTIENSSIVLFNVTKEMVNIVFNTLEQWNGPAKQKQQNSILPHKQNLQDEPIEFVSHYIIVNQTGYPIQIYDNELELKHVIQNNCQVNYNVELDDCDIEEQNVIINMRIVHPKLKLKTIQKLNLNSNRVRRMFPICETINNFCCPIIFRPIFTNSKQYFYITSCLQVVDNVSSEKPIKYSLPFDQNHKLIQLTTPVKLEFSLQKLRKNDIEVDFKRYTLITQSQYYCHTISISHKYTATNVLPVGININGEVLEPHKSKGFKGELLINGERFNKTYYKTITNKNQVFVYCEAYFVDYYGVDVLLADTGKLVDPKYTFVRELKNELAYIYILPKQDQKLAIRLKGRKTFSKGFEVPLGRMFVDVNDPEAYCEFSLISYLRPVDMNSYGSECFQKVIQLTARYVIINSTKSCIKVNQVDSLISTTLQPSMRQPFFWQSPKKPRSIRISTFDQMSFWGYSGPLNLFQNSQCFTLRKAQDPSCCRIFRCELQHTDHITYINITQQSSKFKLYNSLQDAMMIVYQKGIHDAEEVISPDRLMFRVGPGQTTPFGYEFPSKEARKVVVTMEFLDQQMRKVYAEPLEVDLESNLFSEHIYMNKDGKRLGFFTVRLDFEGSTKKLSLVDRDIMDIEDEPEMEFIVRINKLGLSLVGDNNKKRTELMYLQLDKIDYQQIYSIERIQYSLKILRVRLQNQRQMKLLFPVAFQSLASSAASPSLQFKLSRNKLNSKLVHYIGLSINRSSIAITSQDIQILYDNFNEIKKNTETTQKNSPTDEIIDYNFMGRELGKQEEKYYFVMAEVHPLKGKMAFKQVGDWGGRLFKTFSHVSECMIRVNGIKITHFTCTNISGFINQVARHYKQNILKTILPLILNISILGNPMSLATRIASGFKDIIELPAQGFEISPLEGGKGLARGMRSLFQNSFQGAFNSVEAITDTFGSGIASLVEDKEFEMEREKIRNQRSEHVFEGLFNGGKSILNGIGNGFKGLVMDPIKGAEKDGIGGLLLGGLKGVAGLVLKPVTGIIDATTKTAEGIKNTANYLNPKQRERRLQRVRYPRPFYTPDRAIKAYDSTLAYINFVVCSEQQKYSNLNWCNYYQLQHKTFLLLTYELLIFYDFESNRCVKQYECKMIVRCEEYKEDPQKVLFKIRQSDKNGDMKIKVKENRRRLIADVKQVISHFES